MAVLIERSSQEFDKFDALGWREGRQGWMLQQDRSAFMLETWKDVVTESVKFRRGPAFPAPRRRESEQ